jgi:hypothetical protein
MIRPSSIGLSVAALQARLAEAGERLNLSGGAQARVDVEALKKKPDAAVAEELSGRALEAPAEVESAVRELGYFDRDDVARGVAEKLDDGQLKGLAGTPDGRKLLERLRTELDEGWTTGDEEKQIKRIDGALAAPAPATAPGGASGDTNVPESLSPRNEISKDKRGNELVPFKKDGATVRSYQTGDNITKVPDGALEATPAEIAKTRADQAKQIADMEGMLGKGKVSNPPTIEQAQQYFQKVAGRGTPAEMTKLQAEYGAYLKNFYVHAGQGVDWAAKDANGMVSSFKDQPMLKDGRTVIDCEGFAALTEKILGNIKEPGTQKPMFELMQGATPDHAITGVFRSGDPFSKPFMVSNDKVSPVTADTLESARKLNTKPGQTESLQKFLLKELVYDEVNGGRAARLKKQADRDPRNPELRPAVEAGRTMATRTAMVGGR